MLLCHKWHVSSCLWKSSSRLRILKRVRLVVTYGSLATRLKTPGNTSFSSTISKSRSVRRRKETGRLSALRWISTHCNSMTKSSGRSARLPSNEKLRAELTASYQCISRFSVRLSKVVWLPRKSDARSYEVLHLSRKIILANLKIWCSKMQPFSGNQRPDILTSLMNTSLVLRLPCEMHLCRSSSIVPHCQRCWNCYKTRTYCSLLTRCTIPCASHAERHLNVQKCSGTPGPSFFFTLLTSKCASAHNGVHFFNISTSKSAPNLVQRRATWCALYILTSKCASRHNGVQSFIYHLARWLRARRFSERTFRPSGARNHSKNTINRDFCTFSRTCIFFLPTLSLFFSDLLLFSSRLVLSRLVSCLLFSSLLWLFPPLLFHLPILSEVLLLNFLRYYRSIGIWREKNITGFTALYKTVRNNELFAGTFVLKGTSPCRDLAGRRWWWRRLEVLPTSSSDADVHPIPWSRKKRSPYGLPKSIDPRQASRYPMVGGRDSMESHWVGRFILNSNMYLFLSERNG